MERIFKVDAPLYIDVTCYACKKTVALSNTVEDDGRRYCHSCAPKVKEPVMSDPLRQALVPMMNGCMSSAVAIHGLAAKSDQYSGKTLRAIVLAADTMKKINEILDE